MAPLASTYSFGALTPDTNKSTRGNVSFRMGLINPGNETLNVEFNSQGLENGEVVFPQKLRLKPSETSSVSRSEWISVAPNRYIKPRWVEFYVLTEDSSDSSFSVQAEARKPVLTSESSASPRIVQVREFKYSLNHEEERFAEKEEEDNSPDIFSFGSEEEPEENKSEEPKQYVNPGNSTENVEGDGEESLTTPVLVVVSALSIIYLWRVL